MASSCAELDGDGESHGTDDDNDDEYYDDDGDGDDDDDDDSCVEVRVSHFLCLQV